MKAFSLCRVLAALRRQGRFVSRQRARASRSTQSATVRARALSTFGNLSQAHLALSGPRLGPSRLSPDDYLGKVLRRFSRTYLLVFVPETRVLWEIIGF